MKHGTATGYNYHGCRCDECRKAATKATRASRLRGRKARDTQMPAAAHGTVGGYTNWQCRCDACLAVGRQDSIERNRIRRATT